MITVEQTVLVLLAAGHSERFGDIGSKLGHQFLSRPLGLHVAVALEDMPFKERIAVVADDCPLDYGAHGFRVVVNGDAVRDMGSSVRLGVDCAVKQDAQAILIALADMPRVTAAHIFRMLDAADSPDAVIASSDGISPKPPAIFGRNRFDELLQVKGDEGARALIQSGRHVVTNAAELIDVDTPEDLQHLRELVHAPEALSLPGRTRLR